MRFIHVPSYNLLKLEVLLKWAGDNSQQVWLYLPIEREICKLPKAWVANVIYSVIGESFAEFVKLKIKERNRKMVTEKNLMINIDPHIHQAFMRSTTQSSK